MAGEAGRMAQVGEEVLGMDGVGCRGALEWIKV